MTRFLRSGAPTLIALAALALAACVSRPTWHGDEGTAYEILNQSTLAVLDIDRGVLDGPFGTATRRACAIFIFPGATTGVPVSAAARGNGVLLVRDRSDGHWNGPAFYALRIRGEGPGDRADRRAWVITTGCETLRRLGSKAEEPHGAAGEVDDTIKSDMTAWTLSTKRSVPVSLDDVALRPLPVIALAYYQSPASLKAILIDRTVRNDASAEILSAIERIAN